MKSKKTVKRTSKNHAKKTVKTKAKKTVTVKKKAVSRPRKPAKSLEERLMEMDDENDDLILPSIDEGMRAKLLKEEFKLRKKQPTAWTKTKYRKFAMFAFNRKKKPEESNSNTQENQTEQSEAKQ